MPRMNDGSFFIDDSAVITEEQLSIIKRLIQLGREDQAQKYMDAIEASWELPEEERQEIPIPE